MPNCFNLAVADLASPALSPKGSVTSSVKAVKMFYRIDWDKVNPDDYLFIMQQYFQDQAVEQNIINKYHCKTK